MQSKSASLSFDEFYQTYQQLHQTPVCRTLHVSGVVLSGVLLTYAVLWLDVLVFLTIPLLGYALSWVGHFVFEGNRPATWEHPYYAFKADLRMAWAVLNGRESLSGMPVPVALETLPAPVPLAARPEPIPVQVESTPALR